MKIHPLLSFGLLAALLALPAGPVGATDKAGDAQELAAVEQFLTLSDADLDQMQQMIARIRAMKPAERLALQQEIAKYRQLPKPARDQLRRGWGWMPAEVQEAWREMMQGATPEHRAAIQAKLQSLPPEEKAAYRRKLAEDFLKTKSAKP